MIENRPVARVIAHLMLVLGIIIVAFPGPPPVTAWMMPNVSKKA